MDINNYCFLPYLWSKIVRSFMVDCITKTVKLLILSFNSGFLLKNLRENSSGRFNYVYKVRYSFLMCEVISWRFLFSMLKLTCIDFQYFIVLLLVEIKITYMDFTLNINNEWQGKLTDSWILESAIKGALLAAFSRYYKKMSYLHQRCLNRQ